MTLEEALTKPAISIPDAGRLFFNLGRNSSYLAARRGEFGEVIEVGGKQIVPVIPLAAKFGLKARIGSTT